MSPLGYFRHTDNSSGNGRLLTALVYLNVMTSALLLDTWTEENWQKGDGGELRLFHPGQSSMLFQRVLLGEKNLKAPRIEWDMTLARYELKWNHDGIVCCSSGPTIGVHTKFCLLAKIAP